MSTVCRLDFQDIIFQFFVQPTLAGIMDICYFARPIETYSSCEMSDYTLPRQLKFKTKSFQNHHSLTFVHKTMILTTLLRRAAHVCGPAS